MDYAVWWQDCDGPHVERFDNAAHMLAFLAGWLSNPQSRVLDADARIWQVA